MHRLLLLGYGIASYAVGMASIVYMMGWLGNFAVPRSIDSAPAGPIGLALVINATVFALFCLQHSVMARPRFKQWWTQIIPKSAARSTYILISGVMLFVAMLCWQPMGMAVWHVESTPGRVILYSLYGFGWIVLVSSTFALNHFDLFGLRQVWMASRNQPCGPLKFATPGPYRMVRHPLYVGWMTLVWATPTMSVAHLAFAVATTVYILLAIQIEERDLLAAHGTDYADYQKSTPMLIPALRRQNSIPAARS